LCGIRVNPGRGLGTGSKSNWSTKFIDDDRSVQHNLVVWLAATVCALVVTADAFSFESLRGKKVLVVGGSGRVGGSVVTQLIHHGAGWVVVGGTDPDRFQQAQQRW
jgi:NADPH:quinone reductase-like Zn-dependent oxidoreductase